MSKENGNPENVSATSNVAEKDYDVSNFLKSIEDAMPEGADPVEYFKEELSKAEKRRRGTVAGFTKSQQQLKALEAQSNFLKEKVVSNINLTAEQREELEELKYSDPDAWRAKLDSLEKAQKAKFNSDMAAELERIKNMSVEEFERERCANQLSEFIAANPELDITKEDIAEQIPPIYIRKLTSGQISFEEFLGLTKKFLTAPSATMKKEVPASSGTNVSSIRGTSEAPTSKEAANVLDNMKNLKF